MFRSQWESRIISGIKISLDQGSFVTVGMLSQIGCRFRQKKDYSAVFLCECGSYVVSIISQVVSRTRRSCGCDSYSGGYGPKKLPRVNLQCIRCGRDRLRPDTAVARRIAGKYCQPCSIDVYNASRTPVSDDHKAAKQQNWTERNKSRLYLQMIHYREKARLEMVTAYGGCCSQCGENDPIVLAIDHINNDGSFERLATGLSGGFKMYRQLKRLGWPKDRYQLLCNNCNFKKEYLHRKQQALDRHGASAEFRSSLPIYGKHYPQQETV